MLSSPNWIIQLTIGVILFVLIEVVAHFLLEIPLMLGTRADGGLAFAVFSRPLYVNYGIPIITGLVASIVVTVVVRSVLKAKEITTPILAIVLGVTFVYVLFSDDVAIYPPTFLLEALSSLVVGALLAIECYVQQKKRDQQEKH